MAPLSFAAMAEKKVEDAKPLSKVQLSGHVVLKIAKHCKECMPNLVTGQLLGLDVGSTLEVTDCFPFPVRSWERAACCWTAAGSLARHCTKRKRLPRAARRAGWRMTRPATSTAQTTSWR